MENIDDLKRSDSGVPRYRLSNTNVFVSPGGYHYIDYLDPIDNILPEVNESVLPPEDIAYIENALQSNLERFENQTNIVEREISVKGKRVLDIGCGGGLFLSKLKKKGAVVIGIELNNIRANYAKAKYDLEIIKQPIEAALWKEEYSATFDVVCLWDVIEHVNYPLSTLRSSSYVLKSGGFLFIDTPCRDSTFHRIGELTYRLSNGRFPTFLNSMYSAHMFGHKQIFSTNEMRDFLVHMNLDVVELVKFHELSFPHSYYLKKLLRSDLLVRLLLPLVRVLLYVFPVKNKMLVIGRKK